VFSIVVRFESPDDDAALGMVRIEVEKLCRRFPLYPEN